MATELKGEPITLVYAGKRAVNGGKVGHIFYPLKVDGTLGEKMLYTNVKGMGARTVGGVYEGARFDEKSRVIYGLPAIRWNGTFKDKNTVAGWEGLDHECEKGKAAARAESKYKPGAQAVMLGVRRTLHNLHKRGAHAEAAAYRDMVIAEIYRPLTKEEKEDTAE